MKWRWHLGLGAVLALAAPSAAQVGAVEGFVTEAQDGRPLPGANVVMLGTDRGVVAQLDGSFRLDALPAGSYTVQASFVGFEPGRAEVRIEAGETVFVSLVLQQSAEFEGFDVVADRLRAVGRVPAPTHLTPQAVSVITASRLRAEGAVDVHHALRNVSGVVLGGREQPFGTFTLRGLPADGSGSFRRNGIEFPHYADALRPNVVQVEVLRGPASVLYGRIEPGGIVNFVTRQPQCGEGARTASLRGASHGTVGAHVTLTMPCDDERLGVAGDVAVERRGSHRADVSEETAFGAIVARHQLGNLMLTAEAEVESASAGLDPGMVVPGATMSSEIDRSTFFGEPEARYGWGSAFGSFAAERWIHGAAIGRLTSRIAYGSYRHRRDLITLDSLMAGGMVARSLTADDTRYRYLYAELSADGRFGVGSIGNEWVMGLEGTRLAIDVEGHAPLRHSNGTFYFAAIEPVDRERPWSTGLPSPDERVRYVVVDGDGLNLGVFAHNRASIDTPLGQTHLVAALRLAHVTAGAEWFALAATPDTPAGINERRVSVTAITPSAAVLFEPAVGLSIYGSYATSFNPIFQHVSADGEPFEPTRGEQFEVGAKVQRRGLSAAAAVYDLTKHGALSRAPDGFMVQTGAQRSQGLELELAVSPSPRLDATAAYSWMHARVTADDVIPIGHHLPAAPRHSGRIWGTYAVSPRLAASAGVQHVGSRYATLGNELRLPPYSLVDMSLTLRPLDSAELALAVDNLFDERYLLTGEERVSSAGRLVIGWPGQPRTATVRLRMEF